jgi:hypothetical protein
MTEKKRKKQSASPTGANGPIYNIIVASETDEMPAGYGDVAAVAGTEQLPLTGTGKRLRRLTVALSKPQVTGIIDAAIHADRIGLPFNRHVTLRLAKAGIADADAISAIGKFLTKCRDWLRKQGLRTAYAWVRETGNIIGSHVHIMLHLPDGVRLEGHRTRRWIEAISGQPYAKGTIHTRQVSRRAYAENLVKLVGYLCKGAAPKVADDLGLTKRKAGGAVRGKRAGWSENIGLKARQRLSWTSGHVGAIPAEPSSKRPLRRPAFTGVLVEGCTNPDTPPEASLAGASSI